MSGRAKVSKAIRNIKGFRAESGLNQADFWIPLGCTQSAGSRFENGRKIPTPTAILLVLREQGIIDDEALKQAMRTVKASRK
ncbi:helix-turn-helix transcriptional regulator [Viridibacterium curvum]|uniref:RsaL-like HTH domain-containing protein n=1 Tax=Viridibacterium curvum TaxID=1101404 RepID=A0ABP9R7N8_9RHOO